MKVGTDDLKAGTSELVAGASQLSDGLKEFNEQGIQKLVFAGASEDMDGQVKFIYRTDSIG